MLPAKVALASTGAALVQELALGSGLPVYNAARVAELVDEVVALGEALDDSCLRRISEVGPRDPEVVGALFKHIVLDRSVRALVVYHYERLMRIVRGIDNAAENSPNQTESEAQFARGVRKLRRDLLVRAGMGSWGLYRSPSCAAHVEVFCIKGLGEVTLGDGSTVDLTEGSIHHILRSEIEQFIASGAVKVIDAGW